MADIIDAILGRDRFSISDTDLANAIGGKRVMITGAGGSIGSELALAVAAGEPEAIMMLGHSELPIYYITARVHRSAPRVQDHFDLADIRSMVRMGQLCDKFRPDVVIQAAAIKHIPYAEKSPSEAVLTNVFGSVNVATAALESGCEQVLFVSTDKAVYPTSVMGATKRLAELYLAWSGPHVQLVRFGNVLGSSGSVVPLFESQIAEGEEVTVTHESIERYFMSLDEAASFTLQALSMKQPLAVLDMGRPIQITNIARIMIEQSGKDVPIRFTGLRTGEKLTEDLFYPQEKCVQYGASVLRGTPSLINEDQLMQWDSLKMAAERYDDGRVVEILHSMLREYA